MTRGHRIYKLFVNCRFIDTSKVVLRTLPSAEIILKFYLFKQIELSYCLLALLILVHFAVDYLKIVTVVLFIVLLLDYPISTFT